MSQYFNYFPLTYYSSNNSTSVDTVTNIIARFGFESKLKDNTTAFYPYQVQDSDTPEIIAYKFYNNAERHWIVLLFNDIMDPMYDWPLNYNNFINFVDKKYSAAEYADTANTSILGLSWAQNVNNVKNYFKINTTTVSGVQNSSTIDKITVDANTYANIASYSANTYSLQDGNSVVVATTKETQTYYDYEMELNETKREIKLLRPEFVGLVEEEFKRVISL